LFDGNLLVAIDKSIEALALAKLRWKAITGLSEKLADDAAKKFSRPEVGPICDLLLRVCPTCFVNSCTVLGPLGTEYSNP